MAGILIIDDDPAVSLTLATHARRSTVTDVVRVETAQEGSDATPPARRRTPSSWTCGCRRWAVSSSCGRLRADPRLGRLPVGIITGDYFLGDEVLAEIAALGATVRYKPVWMDDLSALTARSWPRPDG